jgi:hypothetical protein
MTWTSPPPTWQRRHSPAEADVMAAEAAAAVGPEAAAAAAGTLAMEATAKAAEVPWASIGNLSADIQVRIGAVD